MEKLTMDDPESRSRDLVDENIKRLTTLFPELLTEGPDGAAVDVDVLKALVGDENVTDAEEKYGLNWHGKRRARQLALTPSTGTLRPCPEESVNWDTTQNLMIEGDNLEVLKLLQKSYAGKVKLIYIDPPYNTGKDFVYPDNFQDSIRNYLELTGQVEGGAKISSNTEASGRFHTDWLNMMYPRLKLARGLLKSDGAILISIDDNELASLICICNEIFGEENFVGTFVWRRRASSALAESLVSTDHEYVVAYQKELFRAVGIPKDFSHYSNPDNDPRGPWVAGDLTVGMGKELRPNQFYDLKDPETGIIYKANPNRVWAYIPESMKQLLDERRVIFPGDRTKRPMVKRFQNELKSDVNPASTWLADVGGNTEATREMQRIFERNVFEYSKPLSLIKHLVRIAVAPGETVLDFFAGSGTTGDAVMRVNAEDGGNRRFLLVQLPERTEREEHSSIAEIAEERLRRVGVEVLRDGSEPSHSGQSNLLDGVSSSDPGRGGVGVDVGFRVFKLDSSNITAWEPEGD